MMINIGFGNSINADKIIGVISTDAAPIKRMISKKKDEGKLIDATAGRKTKSMIYMINDTAVLSYLQPETIAKKIGYNSNNEMEEVND